MSEEVAESVIKSRSVDELRKLSLFQKQTFHRTVATEVYLTEEGALVMGKLHDNYHDMEMAMLVDRESYTIKEIDARMHRYPFHSCVHSWDSYKRLIGLQIMGGGVLHRVHQLIPRVDGCSHLYTLLEASLRALFIGSGYESMKSQTQAGREERQDYLRNLPLTSNTCISFRTDGKLPDPPAEFLKKMNRKD